jgi:large subunit ribosomal protein L1
MAKLSKRMRQIYDQYDRAQQHNAEEAFKLIKKVSSVNFTETIEVSVDLGIDARKESVRGSLVLPNGTGKTPRVAVFAQGELAEKAQVAGADRVGLEELAEDVQNGNIDFDVAIAAPDAMKVVGKLGRVLGPRGLMPNPRVGTVTDNIDEAVTNAKKGQIQYRNDRQGGVRVGIGKVDFDENLLKQNLEALLNELKRNKPSTTKGIYFKQVTVSSTMGPGVKVALNNLALI